MKWLVRILPLCFLALFGCEIVVVMLVPKKEGEYHVREFGRLPVLLNGRIQPFDSVARNSLLQIRSTGDVPLEIVPSWKFWHHPKKLGASEWLLEVAARPELADTRPIFLIHHAELLGELRLQDKGIEKSGLRYYTFNEISPVLKEIDQQGRQAMQVKSEEQTAFQKQVAKLFNAVMLYQRLKYTLQPPGIEDFAGELKQFQMDLLAAQKPLETGKASTPEEQEMLKRISGPFRTFQTMAQMGHVLVVPPLEPDKGRELWQTMGTSLLESLRTRKLSPGATHLATIATAYHQEKPAVFNGAVADYRKWLEPSFPRELQKGRAEFYYNDTKAFLHSAIIYICAFVLAGIALLTFASFSSVSESLRRSAFYLVILAGVVHTFGLIFRMVLEGRPPVTNLYSSAIFIGWGTMIVGLILERIYRVGIGSMLASLAGFVTLFIAHNLALGGDTMEMLRAVLDTNFWLATHVVVITLGYAATFAAGVLAIFYILLGVLTPLLKAPLGAAADASETAATLGKALSKMVYAIVCFATLFSFLGTVLGGIWADQSWGRFWGWDPKENGALLIVLWNAIILHVRWGRLLHDRGVMNLAVFGNIVTSFSWFGVNMLGVGLHSYGFMDSGFKWLMVFIASQVAVIGLGCLPLPLWRSFQDKPLAANGGKENPQPEAAAG
jgi:cytochrome c-type biogenesis protein CcsB